MIHLVFQQKSAAVLEQAIRLDDTLTGDLMVLNEDFSVGPVADIYEAEGFQQRKAFWEEVQQHSAFPLSDVLVEDKLKVHQLIKKLNEQQEETVWIWMGQNATDVCGYYWLSSQLKNFQGRVFILYLNNLPFLNEKGGIFYPKYLYEILPKEFLKAKRLARPVTPSEFEIDPDEWTKLSSDNAMLRVLEGGKKLGNRGIEWVDTQIKQLLANESFRLPKFLSIAESKLPQSYHPAFVVWRLRILAANGHIHSKGNFEKGWKDIEIAKELSTTVTSQ